MDKELIASQLNHYLSLATIVGGLFIILFACYLVFVIYFRNDRREPNLLKIISEYVLPLGFFASLGGTLMSLFYSEYLLYAPCSLCWYQRIFLYPQVFLFAYAWYRKDKNILPYSLLLSFVGLLIALDHHVLQIGYNALAPCSTAPFAVDCAVPSFIEFGFVTFPLMSLVLFGFLIVIVVVAQKFAKNK
ncbi:disulfide bond formation protein B [Candidatus Gracilibacteria bacterium]|nr:disulfide bond formation protein B [Candidatus Gracilibacteria bacterium]MCF7898478.1 disulfide bond formation protein B [Candidatus Paceibacterota bacterium]